MSEAKTVGGSVVDPADWVDEVARRLLAAAPAGSEVILFGSRARGDHRPDSDIDFMVVEPTVTDRYGEIVRLQRALLGLPVSVDVLVAGRARFEAWKDGLNSVIAHAHREGRRYVRTS